jgi:hypothetical protein
VHTRSANMIERPLFADTTGLPIGQGKCLTQRVWSCSPTLRLIPPLPQADTMAPSDTRMRGRCDAAVPSLRPAGACGTPVALRQAARRVAKPRRGVTAATAATRAPAVAAQAVHRAHGAVCAHERHHPAPQPPRRSAPRAPSPRRPRGIDTARHCCPHADCADQGWLGQAPRQWPAERWPLAAIVLPSVCGLVSRDARHGAPWQTGGGRAERTGHCVPGRRPGEPRDGAGGRNRPQHGAPMAGRSRGAASGVCTVFSL